MPPDQVAEVQGLYGPFTLSERVIQKIWLRQDLTTENLKTASGKSLVVKNPGRWNLQEGPDFKEAKLVLDGVEFVGDVEVHFNLSDWLHHQHNTDKNFDRVLLHVVLYSDQSGLPSPVRTSKGQVPELIHLMPLLKQDLESYALEDALLELERPNELEWVADFLNYSPEERLHILMQRAKTRWRQKVTFARQRLEAEGWEAACHSYALEVLGYKRNRAPMLRLAARYPLAQMRKESALNADELFEEMRDDWKLNGLRPANHPRRRLAQYLELVKEQPDWPQKLKACLEMFPIDRLERKTATFRKAVQLSKLRAEIDTSVFCLTIGKTRLDTLIVDAVLPLAAAVGLLDSVDYWLHWFPGDRPDSIQRFLKQAEVMSRENPLSNGLIQGALGLFLEKGV